MQWTPDGKTLLVAQGGDLFLWQVAAGGFTQLTQTPIAERDPQGAQNVLLIERGRLLVRMEGAFNRATAVRLAGTLSPFEL